MKKSLTALSCAALLVAAAGCSTDAGEAPVSAAASASASPTGTASAAPGTGATAAATPVPLADGFPEGRIPVLEGAEILSSTVERSGGTLTSVLVAASELQPADILAYYDQALTGQGFSAAPSADAAPASRDYVRATAAEPETVNVTIIVKDGSPATVTVGSTLLAEADD